MEAFRWPIAGEASDHMGRSRCRAPLAPGIMGACLSLVPCHGPRVARRPRERPAGEAGLVW